MSMSKNGKTAINPRYKNLDAKQYTPKSKGKTRKSSIHWFKSCGGGKGREHFSLKYGAPS